MGSIHSYGLLGGKITLVSGGAISATSSVIGSISNTAQQGVKGGDVKVIANSLSFSDGASLITLTTGGADAGNVKIKALDTVTFDGVGSNGVSSSAASGVEAGGVGKGGDINITTGSLSVTGGAHLGNLSLGQGDAGSININARDTVTIDGAGVIPSTSTFLAGKLVHSSVFTGSGAEGKDGDITISARSLFLSNGASLGSPTEGGQVDSGNILVNATDTISIKSGASIVTFNTGQGNGGNVTLRAGEQVFISGNDSHVFTTAGGISGNVSNGNGGDINIQTRSLFLSDGASLFSGVLGGQGNSGNIQVKATDSIFVNGGADISTFNTGQGNGGNVTLLAGNRLSLNDGSVLTATFGAGKSGNIDIQTRSLSVTNGSSVNSLTLGGNGGDITILASDAVSFDGVDTGVTKLLRS